MAPGCWPERLRAAVEVAEAEAPQEGGLLQQLQLAHCSQHHHHLELRRAHALHLSITSEESHSGYDHNKTALPEKQGQQASWKTKESEVRSGGNCCN